MKRTAENRSRPTPDILGLLRKRIGPLTVFEHTSGENAGKEEKVSYAFSLQPLVEAMNPVVEQYGCFARFGLEYRLAETNPSRVVTMYTIRIIPHSVSARVNFQKALIDIQGALESSEGKDRVMEELKMYESYSWFEEAQNAFLAVRASLGEAIR